MCGEGTTMGKRGGGSHMRVCVCVLVIVCNAVKVF